MIVAEAGLVVGSVVLLQLLYDTNGKSLRHRSVRWAGSGKDSGMPLLVEIPWQGAIQMDMLVPMDTRL
jgi:hypothetical protein